MAKAMILAAGQGTRVRPLTKDIPKPMIPILGKPVLEYIIEHLARHGVREIMINVAFMHRKIEEYFGDGHRWGVEIGYSYEGAYEHGEIVPKPIGSAGGMKHIQDNSGFFDDTTLVLCGDAIIDLDIGAALYEHRNKGAIASVVTLDVPLSEVKNYGIVVADEQGKIISFQEKPCPEEAKSTLASTGIYIFEPAALDLVPSGQVYDIGSQLFPLLVEKQLPFFAQNRFFNWIDIGRVTDYWTVLQRVLRGEVAQMDMPGKEVRPGVWVGLNTRIDWDKVTVEGPVYIGSSVKIEEGATIVGPTWIGHGSHLRKGATVERSVLFEYTRIGEGMKFSEMIVSARYCVDRHGNTVYVGDDRCVLRWGDARG
ncbi:MAG: mannose-1-phosphate guanyltransferase [Candidatus Dactylopiibacterium carminicum]|uniref:Mannose-1-phosphate guanyltransferase n=1 Tax=Candidatus Dactylopiibacterium carminicum TaxID=857335 RepID=A0A272EZ47_9RHOO|nr:NDP-sugar synthase [Candidatus Dactylopiibacterium carminicum]KAF7600890.1 mannose-1-phosphate guanyltransferase [Candidatus Dactylopiibacterium carminicum]PAS95389.1 MAG: mannose-1-phosphate guanyltransferase [Candidatus Dactylopiibacterium carminicum]PAT00887.1 MAG: mannose-1-phosphate guanyltransferase [Candidatus Dactylopiibacterium carminicum]